MNEDCCLSVVYFISLIEGFRFRPNAWGLYFIPFLLPPFAQTKTKIWQKEVFEDALTIKYFENGSYFCVLVDRQKRGPRKHWHTHHWNLEQKPGSKKVAPNGCFFSGLVWTVETDNANTLWRYFNVIITILQPGTLLNPPISRPRSHSMYLTWTCQSTLLVSSTILRYHVLNQLGPGAEARSQFARRIISCLLCSGKNSEYCFVSVTN